MGRLFGGTPSGRPLVPIPLRFGAATSDRLRQSANNADILTGSGTPGPSFTIGLLVQPTTLTSGRLIYVRDNAGNGIRVAISGTSGAWSVDCSRNGGLNDDTITSSTTVLGLNRWTWIFAVRDVTAATFLSVYSGGLKSALRKDTASGANGSGAWDADVTSQFTTIGNDVAGSPTLAFQGRIAVVTRFTRVLSLNEMQGIQQAALDGDVSPVGWLSGCVELVVPGERGAGVRVNNYGRDNGLSFTQTGTKPCARGFWPALEKSRRRRRVKAPAAGGSFQSAWARGANVVLGAGRVG